MLAPATDDVVPLLDEVEHAWDVARIVLQIAIRRDDVGAARVGEPCSERGGLPEVAAEPDHAQACIERLLRGELRERVIRAAVVDEDHLERAARELERLHELAAERVDVRRFIVNGNDYGEIRGHHGCDRLSGRRTFRVDGCRQTLQL